MLFHLFPRFHKKEVEAEKPETWSTRGEGSAPRQAVPRISCLMGQRPDGRLGLVDRGDL